MNQLLIKLRWSIPNLIFLIFLSIVVAFIHPVPAWAAEKSNYASDLLPPVITVISPLPDSVTDTDTPRIEVSFVDTGSDIDENTVHLELDRLDVTGQSFIERTDITGRAVNSPRKISYRPSTPLTQGVHEIHFSVRDLAGNLAENRWRFEVKGESRGRFWVGGSNTYQFDATPIYKNTDLWDLSAQGQFRESSIQLRLLGRITDYPDATPNYYYNGYNFYYDKYTLQFNRRGFALAVGCATASINSELFQVSQEIKGAMAGDSLDLAAGKWNWSVFSGKTGSSFGVGMNVYNISGFSGEWRSASGWGLGGFYTGIDDAYGYNYSGLKGDILLGGSVLFRYELIHGYSKSDGRSGNGVALHFDTSIASTTIGMDYFGLQPDYPAPGSSETLILTGGGMQRYAVHGVTVINSEQNLNIDASVAVDNPSGNFTTRNNLSIGYNLSPNPDCIFSSNYQGDFQYNNGLVNNTTNRILLNFRKNLDKSSLETSFSFGEILQSKPSDSSDQIQLFSAWTKPIGAYNLTPSVQWTHQYKMNGIHSSVIDTRLTLDRQFYPVLTRSKIALFYQKNEDWSTSPPFLTNIGLETSLFILLWHDSTLFFTGSYSKWIREGLEYSDGLNTSFRLSWRMAF